MLAKCTFLTLVYAIVKSQGATTPEIEETRAFPPAGPLVGILDKSYSGRTYRAFRGIPYAIPPIGERRFERPERLEPWKMERLAKKHGNECVQFDAVWGGGFSGDEDCLFLNIYTPENAQELDVMFWIHGGAFLQGNGNDNRYGPAYYMDHDVVLVTINYRLGHLGFMSTENSYMPGNQGYHDMIMALQWVHDNIAYFGGSPSKVTIFGESAGGTAVSTLRLSPLSVGLFHRAISHSGNSVYASNVFPKKQHLTVAALVGCPLTPIKNMIACLKQVDTVELYNKTSQTEEDGWMPLLFLGPRVDREGGDYAILPDHPIALLKSGAFQRVPYFTGFNREEGLMAASMFTFDAEKGNFVDHICKEFVMSQFVDCQSAAKKIIEKYFGSSKVTGELWVPFITDAYATFFAMEEARLTAKHSPTFFYRMDFQSVNDLDKRGTPHGADLAYHWNTSRTKDHEVDSAEMKMTTSFINLLLGFAKNGAPDLVDVVVPTFDTSKPSYILIGGQEDRYAPEISLVSASALSQETSDFWGELYLDYGGRQHQFRSSKSRNTCYFTG